MTAEVAPPHEEKHDTRDKKTFELVKVIVEKVTGTVKWFSINRRYGFIQRDDNNEDVFVHRTAITASKQRFPSLKSGELVEFSVVETTGGINAASVTGPGGKPVRGAHRFLRRGPFLARNEGSKDNKEVSTEQQTEDEKVPQYNYDTSYTPGGDGDAAPRRGGNFRSRRRGAGAWRRQQTNVANSSSVQVGYHDAAGDNQENRDCQNGGFSPTGGAPRSRPRPRRGRGSRAGGAITEGYDSTSRNQPYDAGEYAATGDEQHRLPRRGMRRPFRRGGRRSAPNGAQPQTFGEETNGHEHEKPTADELEHPIEKQMGKMKIEDNVDKNNKQPTQHQPDEFEKVHSTKETDASSDSANC